MQIKPLITDSHLLKSNNLIYTEFQHAFVHLPVYLTAADECVNISRLNSSFLVTPAELAHRGPWHVHRYNYRQMKKPTHQILAETK